MTSVEFCYWLQGLFELADPTSLTAEQTKLIKAHLNMVFFHEIDKKYPEEEQKTLNDIHSDSPYTNPPNSVKKTDCERPRC